MIKNWARSRAHWYRPTTQHTRDGRLVNMKKGLEMPLSILTSGPAYLIARAMLLTEMIERKFGRIINTCPVNGTTVWANQLQRSQGSVMDLQTLAMGQCGITVNTISSDFIGTDMVRPFPGRIWCAGGAGPMGRLEERNEVAHLVGFLGPVRNQRDYRCQLQRINGVPVG